MAGCQPSYHIYLVNGSSAELLVSLKGMDPRYCEFFPDVPLNADDQFVLAPADSIRFIVLWGRAKASQVPFDTLMLQGGSGERVLAGKDSIFAHIRPSRGSKGRLAYP
jgi:hypothetical protein